MKLVTCENCTEEQASDDPFEYVTDEMEVEQMDYEVLDVTESK